LVGCHSHKGQACSLLGWLRCCRATTHSEDAFG
jgi:hypothetical protein